MVENEIERMIAVMRGYERKSRLLHYNMWSKKGPSYDFKIGELNCVMSECPSVPQSSAVALDAGCGPGVYSSMLLSKGYRVVGLDVSVGMLRKAKTLIASEEISYVRGSVTHLPFKKELFDLILCVDTLHHLPEKFLNMAFHQFKRTAKRNGTFITDTRNPLNPLLFLRYKMEDRRWTEKAGLTLKARSLGHMMRKLKRFGFKPVNTTKIGFGFKVFAPYIVIVSET